MKMTWQRKEILAILEKTKEPVSCEMVFKTINDLGINLSTVYRTLDVFFEKSIVTKCYFNNIAYYYLTKKHHEHFMFCTTCNHAFPLDCHFDEWLGKTGVDDFKIERHDIIIYGTCAACNNEQA